MATEEEKKKGLENSAIPTEDKSPSPETQTIEAPAASQQATPEAPDSSPSITPTSDVQPEKSEVNAETDTVGGQITGLLADNSKYIQQARTDARREANNRGLINSVMAAGAGEEAAIRAALPIAQQDAETYNQTRLVNQEYENTFRENRQSTDLNKEFAAFENMLEESRMRLDADLKMEVDQFMNDEKFSDEIKLQYVATINNIMRDTQQQILEVGLSDASPNAQAAAIKRIEKNRDAEIKVYKKLLKSFDDWDWSTDFIPDSVNVRVPGSGRGGGRGGGGNQTAQEAGVGAWATGDDRGGGADGSGVGGGANHGGPTGGGGSGVDGR